MAENQHIYFEDDADIKTLADKKIAVIGYGNQGRAQALNMRDSGLDVIIGNNDDSYKQKASDDNFEVFSISKAVERSDIVFVLTPDETMSDMFSKRILPKLQNNQTLIFASGYNIAFNLLEIPDNVDILLIAPRMIGVGVRERYLNEKGFFCFISVDQDASKLAKQRLLALTKAIGGLKMGAIEITMKQEAILDLFNEQAFGPAFGRVLLTSIKVLLDNGLPPEAVLTEMYLSGEMSYTYQKMAQIGLVKQTNFHSHTSQYGAMSRGIRFLNLDLEKRMQKIYDEISSGEFAREWSKKFAKLKFKVIKFFAMKQNINRIEKYVRKSLKLKEWDVYSAPEEIEDLLKDPKIKEKVESFEEMFEF